MPNVNLHYICYIFCSVYKQSHYRYASVCPSGIFAWIRYGPDVMIILVLLSGFLAAGSLLAWRWIVVTVLLFGGLFAINEIYVTWAKYFVTSMAVPFTGGVMR